MKFRLIKEKRFVCYTLEVFENNEWKYIEMVSGTEDEAKQTAKYYIEKYKQEILKPDMNIIQEWEE